MIREVDYSPRLFRLALVTVLATLVLIGLGGMVTSKGVGLSVPDWPNSYGYNMFLLPFSHWVGGILWEHSHRLAGSLVGLLALVLVLRTHGSGSRAVLRYGLSSLFLGLGLLCFLLRDGEGIWQVQSAWLFSILGVLSHFIGRFWPRCAPAPLAVRRLSLAALAVVVPQGVLGGLRVVLIENSLGALHAALAQILLVLFCAIALLCSRWWRQRGWARIESLRSRLPGAFLLLLSLLVLGQLVLGASMRHRHAGLPVDSFPLVEGRLLPAADADAVEAANRKRDRKADYREYEPITRTHLLLYRYHLILAYVVIVLALASLCLCWRRYGRHPLVFLQMVLASLILLQGLLGASTVWSDKAADIATLHVMCGALLLAFSSLSAMIGLRVAVGRAPLGEAAPMPVGRIPGCGPLESPGLAGE